MCGIPEVSEMGLYVTVVNGFPAQLLTTVNEICLERFDPLNSLLCCITFHVTCTADLGKITALSL